MELPLTSPFVFERPLAPSEVVDREEETAQLLGAALAGRYVRLIAPRRYGKTSLVGKVLDDAKKKHKVSRVYVDFSGAVSVADVTAKIERAYARQLKGTLRRKVQVVLEASELGLSLGPVGVAARFAQRDFDPVAALEALLDLPAQILAKGSGHAIVVLDEFQEVLRIERVDALLRSHIQHHGGAVSYIFCGSEPGMMRALFEEKARPLYGQTIQMRLGRLRDAHLSSYIRARFDATGKSVGETLPSLLRLASGHPQRAMLLAHALWRRVADGGAATSEDWLQAVSAVQTETAREFEELWRHLPANDKKACKAIAHSSGTPFSARVLRGVELAKGTAHRAVGRLIDSGELEEEKDTLRFVDPLFHLWLTEQILEGPAAMADGHD